MLAKTLRDDQALAVYNVREAVMRGENRIVVQGPTGMGKGLLIADIVDRALIKGKKVLISVPAISLVDQTIEVLAAEGIRDVGVIQAQHPMTDWSRPVQVCSVQTLVRRWSDQQMPKADVVLVDEVHRWFTLFPKWLCDINWQDVPFIGFSATPWTKGLGAIYKKLIVANTIDKLIGTVLVPFRTFAPDSPDLSGVSIVAGDFVADQLEEVMRPKKLVANIVETWRSLAEGRPTVCFCCSRAHADQVAKEFEARGIGAGYMDCETSALDRAAVRRRMLAGEVKVVCNVEIVGIGVDWPEISCIIYARPTMSDMRFCLDSKTDVLTSHGWRGMGDVREGDCVATLADLDTGRGQWSRVLGVIERDMHPDEAWIEYHGPQSDFRVTNNHRMIFSKRPTVRRKGYTDEPYLIAPADDMISSRDSKRIPVAVRMDQPGVPLTDAELYFIGIMMTDGTWARRSGGISQSERHPEVIERIERCLIDCGIAFSKRRIPTPTSLHSGTFVERHARWQYSLSFGKPVEGLAKPRRSADHLNPIKHGYERVPGRSGFEHLLPFLDKDVAPALMALSRAQFLVLLQGIHDGDGHKLKAASVDWTPRSWTLCSARKLMVERLQALAAINGFSAHLHQERRQRNSFLHVLTITPKDWRSVHGYPGVGHRVQIERKPMTHERVWCVETETGTVVTRRNGKVMVMGNCQNIGRGLRCAEGKTDLLILDHSTTTMRLGFVDEIYQFHKELDDGKAKPKQEIGVLLPKECTACHYMKPPRTPKCPNCGFVMEVHATPIMVQRGTLREITADAERVTLLKRLPEKPYVFGMLWWWGHRKGYKSGWAAVKCKELFGSFPKAREPDADKITAPIPELLEWIYTSTSKWASRQQYAKRKARQAIVRSASAPSVERVDAPRALVPGTLCTEEDLEDFS